MSWSKKELYYFHKEKLKFNSKLAILLTNGSAIEIVDDKCKIITKEDDSFLSSDTDKAFPIVSYYDGNDYNESKISENSDFEEFNKSLVLKLKK